MDITKVCMLFLFLPIDIMRLTIKINRFIAFILFIVKRNKFYNIPAINRTYMRFFFVSQAALLRCQRAGTLQTLCCRPTIPFCTRCRNIQRATVSTSLSLRPFLRTIYHRHFYHALHLSCLRNFYSHPREGGDGLLPAR